MTSQEVYDEYNEGSAFSISVTFRDEDGNIAVPITISYEIYDFHTGTVLKSSTSVTPASTITIAVTSDVNRIVKEFRDRELHILLVKTNYGTGDDLNGEYKFYIKNLGRV